jgi:hypothetical protein
VKILANTKENPLKMPFNEFLVGMDFRFTNGNNVKILYSSPEPWEEGSTITAWAVAWLGYGPYVLVDMEVVQKHRKNILVRILRYWTDEEDYKTYKACINHEILFGTPAKT